MKNDDFLNRKFCKKNRKTNLVFFVLLEMSVICRKFNKDLFAMISGALEQSNPLNINIIYIAH